MAWRTAVGAKTVSGVINVVIADGVPLRIEMLINPVLALACHVVNDHRGNAQGAVEPFTVMRHVIHNQEGFDSVHIGVATTVLFGFAEGLIPGFQAHLFLFAPEITLNHLDGIVQ